MKTKENKKRQKLRSELMKSGFDKETAANMAESVYPKKTYLNDSTFKFYLSGYIQTQSEKGKKFLNEATLSPKQKRKYMEAKRKVRQVNELTNQLRLLSTL